MDASDPSRAECLPETRTALIDSIAEWAFDPNTHTKVLWLHGLAGSGKSTLSTTIANLFRVMGSLGAFLFFDRAMAERRDPSTVIRTLAHQLSSLHPRVGLAIAKSDTFAGLPDFAPPLRTQFEDFFVNALSPRGVMDPDAKIVLVLDALDECDMTSRGHLLEVLAKESAHIPSNLRLVITSRAHADIRHAFMAHPHILAQELDITSELCSDDILTYFRHHMNLIREKTPSLEHTEWPGEDQIQQLTHRACGLFIWASTAYEFIRDTHDPRKRLNLVLQGSQKEEAEAALNKLYQIALEETGRWDDTDFVEDFQAIIGMVLVLRNPLSSAAIDSFGGIPDGRSANDILRPLNCLVSSDPTVRIIHPSFADFLMDRQRCGRDIWLVNKSFHNRILAHLCLHHLDQKLKRNLCNLTLFVEMEDEIPDEDVAYACLFWVDHVCDVNEDVLSIMQQLDTFFRRHLLHWFEVMSIMRKSRHTIRLLRDLSAWIMVGRTSSFLFCLSKLSIGSVSRPDQFA